MPERETKHWTKSRFAWLALCSFFYLGCRVYMKHYYNFEFPSYFDEIIYSIQGALIIYFRETISEIPGIYIFKKGSKIIALLKLIFRVK